MKILHIITGLNNGGAEAVLYRLCKHDRANQHCVVSLCDHGKYGPMLTAIGVSVRVLDMSPRWPSPLAFIRLVGCIRQENPDVVQTWMYHADLFGGIAARLAGIRSVVWGIRHTSFVTGKTKITTIWIANLLAKLSWWLPARIVVCSQRAMDVHQALGYNRRLMTYIPNGYNLTDYRPGLDPNCELRASLVGSPLTPLLAMVARFDPQKDHLNLLDALAILKSRRLVFCCLLIGPGLDISNSLISNWICERELSDKVKLLGQRNDIPEIMNAVDLHVLSSAYGEAFPNVVSEAMACGTPCVVTDVGDSASIVGNTGWVVPPSDPKALANALELALSLMHDCTDKWLLLTQSVRQKIESSYSIDQMVIAYSSVWASLLVR